MALDLTYSIVQNYTDGTSIDFTDITPNYGVGGNINYSDVLAVRLYFGIYANQIAPATLNFGASMDEYREYQKTSFMPSVYDNKIIVNGQSYIPFVTGLTVGLNDSFVTTGRYSKFISPATYLPTINKLPLILLTSDLGISQSVFSDGVYYLTYEVYISSGIISGGTVTANTQYMVYGNGTVVYNGSTYRQGEVFIAADNNPVTYTGAASLVVLSSIVFRYFTLTFNIESQLAQLVLQLVQDCKCNASIWYQIAVMRAKLESIKLSDIMNKTDAELAQQLILEIQIQIASIYNSRAI